MRRSSEPRSASTGERGGSDIPSHGTRQRRQERGSIGADPVIHRRCRAVYCRCREKSSRRLLLLSRGAQKGGIPVQTAGDASRAPPAYVELAYVELAVIYQHTPPIL